MLCVTGVSLKVHWREGCIRLAVEFKYQQAFSRIIDYTFNRSHKLSILLTKLDLIKLDSTLLSMHKYWDKETQFSI